MYKCVERGVKMRMEMKVKSEEVVRCVGIYRRWRKYIFLLFNC